MIKLIAVLLIVWEPLNFAAAALMVLPTLAHRGWLAAMELLAHGASAALSAAAGLALLNDAPDARRLAAAAVIVSTARVVQSLYWSVLPNNTAPGDELFYAAVAVTIGGLVLVLLQRRSS